MAALLDEFLLLIRALNDDGIEYAVCGGLALAIHGFSRQTVDIDILIRSESLDDVYALGERNGYDIRGLDISFKERAVEIRRLSKIGSDHEVLSLDMLLVTPQVEDVWETRESMVFLGTKLNVVSVPGLIKMKTLAGRPQDLVDIERLQNEES